MFLSRLVVDPTCRAVRRDLADCQAMHRTIMSAFPATASGGKARAQWGVLYRVDTHRSPARITLLVQSRVKPDWSRLEPGYLAPVPEGVDNPACKAVGAAYDSLKTGARLVFRLKANPTRKVDTRSGPDGQRRNGRRVLVLGEETQIEWLRRKGEQSGFEVLTVRHKPEVPSVYAKPEGKLIGHRRRDGDASGQDKWAQLTFASVVFEGLLRITDEDRFRQALQNGIGSGKAYGFGLLSVAPPNEM